MDAYRDLLFKKPYDRITVTDVINEANISRGTFYAYYSDIHDLAENAEDQMMTRIRELIRGAAAENLTTDPRKMLEIITGDLEKHRDKVRIMLEKNSGLRLHERLKEKLKKSLNDEFQDIKEPERSVMISYTIGGVLEACIDWILSDDPCDRKILIETVTALIEQGNAYLHVDRHGPDSSLDHAEG